MKKTSNFLGLVILLLSITGCDPLLTSDNPTTANLRNAINTEVASTFNLGDQATYHVPSGAHGHPWVLSGPRNIELTYKGFLNLQNGAATFALPYVSFGSDRGDRILYLYSISCNKVTFANRYYESNPSKMVFLVVNKNGNALLVNGLTNPKQIGNVFKGSVSGEIFEKIKLLWTKPQLGCN